MAADDDDKTRIGTAPPPLPKLPAKAPADEDADLTHIAAVPPPTAKLRPPIETPPAAEQTRVRAAPSPTPHAPAQPAPPPAATPPSSGPPKYVQDDEDDATVILVQRPQTNVRLQRLQPPGRSEIILLDRTTYLLGRSHTCDIELFSATASRTHARLTNRDGKWYVAPLESRSVRVNGVAVNGDVPLTHKGRVQLGGDELLFLDESGAAATVAAPPTPTLARRRWASILFVVAIVAVVATALWWLLRS